MDIFGRKRIAELERQLSIVTSQLKNDVNTINRLEASELRLMGQIREMDTAIFDMSQKMSWDQQRPIFQGLLSKTMARRNAESQRIQTLLIPEMQKAYRK